MGSDAALDSIERVLAAHGRELHEETWENLPEAVKALKPRLELEGEIEEIERWLVFVGADGKAELLALAPITIFELEERFPDCEIGY
jgi:hypothetical protein